MRHAAYADTAQAVVRLSTLSALRGTSAAGSDFAYTEVRVAIGLLGCCPEYLLLRLVEVDACYLFRHLGFAFQRLYDILRPIAQRKNVV